MNYYKRHLGDYAAATRHLSLLEHGVYTLLLDIYYISEAALPSDDRAIYRLIGARSKEEREAVGIVLQEFFCLQEDGWHQPRCDDEIARKQAQTEINREIGRRGGRPQTESVMETQTESVTEKNRIGYETETESGTESKPNRNPSHKPIANSHKPVEPIPPFPPSPGGQGAKGPPPLPDWLPTADWQAFVDHRRALKAPMSALAQAKAISELGRLMIAGDGPEQVISQSIIHGWKGLFPLKNHAVNGSARPQKFDPVAFVNRNRTDHAPIDITHLGDAH